jgi:serine/arginine repetitive matrix protein 2
MFSALNSIQGFRRRGNSTSSTVDASVDLQYPESVSSSKSSGPSLSAFPETAAVQESIYPFASLSSTSSSSKRHSNNLFGSARFRDASALKGVQRNRSLSSSTNSQDSIRATPISSDNENAGDLNGVPEESSSDSPSSSQVEAITTQQLSDKDKTPTARISRLPVAPRLPNGNTLTVAQIRRMSMALERAISAIVETEHEADDDEERILAPHSVPLGGAYPSRPPPTVRRCLF